MKSARAFVTGRIDCTSGPAIAAAWSRSTRDGEVIVAVAGDLPHVGILAFPSESVEWLGALADAVKGWFQKGFRIPQELVGFEQLVRGVEVACGVPEDDQ